MSIVRFSLDGSTPLTSEVLDDIQLALPSARQRTYCVSTESVLAMAKTNAKSEHLSRSRLLLPRPIAHRVRERALVVEDGLALLRLNITCINKISTIGTCIPSPFNPDTLCGHRLVLQNES
jgi:hypothetical protein